MPKYDFNKVALEGYFCLLSKSNKGILKHKDLNLGQR